MSSINWVDGQTIIPAAWMNDANIVVYTYFGNGVSLNSPSKLKVGSIGIGVAVSSLGLTVNPGNILGITGAGTTNVTIVAQDATSNLSLDIRNNTTGGSLFSVANNGVAAVSTSVVTPFIQPPSGTLKVVGTNGLDLQYIDNTNQVGGGALTLGTTGVSSGYIISRENLYIKPNNVGGTGSGTFNVTDKDLNAKFSVNTSSGVVTIPGSVVTPLVSSTAQLALNAVTGSQVQLQINGVATWFGNAAEWSPNVDNTQNLGRPTLRIANIFTPVIDSGTAGSLLLKTNNGAVQVQIPHIASAVNFLAAQGAATGGTVALGASFASADTDVPISLYSKGAGVITLGTNAANSVQLQILHTASATRNITITGSNGGNPTISTTAGALALGNGQLQWPATPNPSADVNTLDDYKEGTWTPSVGGTATYTTQTGTYTKIGRLVFVRATITINTIGTGSTTTISGLPFTVAVSTALSLTNVSQSATNFVSISGRADAGATTITLLSRTVATNTETASSVFGNSTTVMIAGCYEV